MPDNLHPAPLPSLPNPLVDSRITRSLGADYEALKNDLEQANEFAGELQNELAVNQNDLAHFKQLFERTRQDLDRMQESILALRQERHHLANEAMKAVHWEAKVTIVTKERDDLLGMVAEARQTIQDRDSRVANLTMQIALLKNTFRQVQEMHSPEIAAKRFEPVAIDHFEP